MVNGKKKPSDSAAGDSTGLRMSTRSQNNSSPNLRKSNRLEGRSPPATPPVRKKPENPSPLRRSGKDKTSPPSKASKQQKVSKQDQTLKEIAKEVGNKKVKRLDARSYRDMFKPLKKPKTSDSESDKKRKLEYSDTSGDSDFDNAAAGEHKHSDREEVKGDDNDGGIDSVVKDNTCADKPRKMENGDNPDKTKEVSGSGALMEKLSNGLGCSQKGIISGASTIENEGSDPRLSEECAKCFRNRSLERDSPEQELCCCLSNIVNDVDGSKDRGQCGTITAGFADEHGQNVKQSNSSLDICDACQRTGKLLHCCGKGCKRSYHPSCSLNPEKNIYLPNWYCSECTKKRFAFGVHSVSQGVESVFDVRDVGVSTEGRPKQKQCFVKYNGLAHIHNRWLPEIQLCHEVPKFHAKGGKLNEDRQWNPVWAVPQRLLLRRLVTINDTDQETRHEWLVKWSDLDYDQATWELEDLSIFKSPEGQQLIKEYEARHNKARNVPLSVNNEIQEKRKGSHVKLGKHLAGGADNYYQNIVNKLREWHHKGQNAILLDEQDRLMKTIYLVSSLVASVSRPFLIIAPHASLSSWEAEFRRLASPVNVVVYGGKADARDIIRSAEFFEDGQVMFQVLLSNAEVIAEDTEKLKGIEWEAVIVDDCQQSCILVHSGDIMNLATGWRLLLINAQLEDNVSEYINILSLLEPGCRNLNEEINVLKDKLSSFIISARFIEYWVPVEMSNLQLEQYCFSILSKSSVLKSVLKSDPVGSLREIVISLRKCCDHPYIVDMQLQTSLAYGLPYEAVMDLGIKASGKLYLLDKLLSELKNQGHKVLILYQAAGGSGRDSTANILEDFLRFRFGSDSYEHVESGLVLSKKQNACNQFNSVKERSFLLLETRACSASMKLSLVDAVIIFDSDWNPLNDLRALQKITVDSKIDQIKVFRLYCPGTVEEKVLILAKNDVFLDSHLQITSPSTSHMLLMWGSSNLFSRLQKFHNDNVSDFKDNIVFGSSLSMDVTQEIVSLFQNNKKFISSKNISVAQQNGGCYLKNIPVIGEQRILADDGVSPHVFWTNLLEGLKPQWKYLSGSSQRNRKRVHYNEELPSRPQSDEATKRRKKTDNTKKDISLLQAEPRLETLIVDSQHKANTDPNAQTDGTENSELDELKNLHKEQRGLFELLKPNMLQLCEALLLKDDEKRFVERFLKYLVKNYRVTKEPETRLQAFLLSVCWTAVEGLKNNIDHKNSVAIVREKLDFACSENEAEDIYSKLKPIYSCSGITNQHSTAELLLGNGERSFEKFRRKVEKRCDKQMEKLKVKHAEELKKFEKSWEDERMKLEHWCKVESAAIRITHANSSVGIDKLRALDNDYARKREELESKILTCRKELEARQQIEREEEQKKITRFMERVKALEHSSHAKNGINSNVTDPIGPGKEAYETMCNNGNLLEKQNTEREESRTCDNDDSINASEKIAMSNGNGIITCQPEQPCASTEQAEEETNNSTSLLSNETNIGQTTASSMNPLITDTSQALGAVSHIEVEHPVATGINNSSTFQESSLLNITNHEASNLTCSGEMNNSTEFNIDECNRVAPNSRIDNRINETPASIGGTIFPIHQDHSNSSLSGVAFSQHHPQLTIDQLVNTNHVPIGVVPPHASLPGRLPVPFTSISRAPPSLHDPLQLELERLRNELTKVMNHHEGTKLQLKSECDKEIEEVVTQIRKKYERKLEEAETSFSQKRNELDMCQHKVMMNKILAEAFRSKCTDYKAAPKIPQLGISSSSSSMENSSRSHHTRPFPVTSPVTTTPVSSPLNTAPPVQRVGPTTSVVTQSRMARINPGVAPMTSQQQVRRESHTPPSTIQAFSSSTPISSSGVQTVPQRNHPTTPQLSTLNQSNHHGRPHQEGSLGRGTMLSHLSNTELLRDITRRNDESLRQFSSNIPPSSDNMPSSKSWDISQFEGVTNTQPISSSSPAGDVVCLSDDE